MQFSRDSISGLMAECICCKLDLIVLGTILSVTLDQVLGEGSKYFGSFLVLLSQGKGKGQYSITRQKEFGCGNRLEPVQCPGRKHGQLHT